jgi:diacylglycerol kinase family enzyme
MIEGEFIYGMITNSTSVGGFRKLIRKNVLLDDGEFEVMLIRKPRNPMEMQEILKVFLMEATDSECILTFRASALTIDSPEEVPWVLDGEFGGTPKEITIKNQRQALSMICPREG